MIKKIFLINPLKNIRFKQSYLTVSLPKHYSTIYSAIPLAVILLWLGLYVSGTLNILPLFFRFVFTVIIFSWVPGYVLFHLLNLRSINLKIYDVLSTILVSFSLSFSWTFFLNILVFIFCLIVRL